MDSGYARGRHAVFGLTVISGLLRNWGSGERTHNCAKHPFPEERSSSHRRPSNSASGGSRRNFAVG